MIFPMALPSRVNESAIAPIYSAAVIQMALRIPPTLTVASPTFTVASRNSIRAATATPTAVATSPIGLARIATDSDPVATVAARTLVT